jgi:hypothetical protein
MSKSRVGLAGLLLAGLVVLTGCGFGTTEAFSLSSASVDPSYSCPAGASNTGYQLHGTIDAHNPTSTAVTIKTVVAVMTLATFKGNWLQHVGDTYKTNDVVFTPAKVAAGSSTTINVALRSACTNGKVANQPVSYGDYTVSFTVSTSTGSLNVSSKNKHRISTA